MKNEKMKYGKVDLLPPEGDRSDELIRISMMIEGDLLDEIKARAKHSGLPYQIFIKQALRQFLAFRDLGNVEVRMTRLEERVNDLLAKVPKKKRA